MSGAAPISFILIVVYSITWWHSTV